MYQNNIDVIDISFLLLLTFFNSFLGCTNQLSSLNGSIITPSQVFGAKPFIYTTNEEGGLSLVDIFDVDNDMLYIELRDSSEFTYLCISHNDSQTQSLMDCKSFSYYLNNKEEVNPWVKLEHGQPSNGTDDENWLYDSKLRRWRNSFYLDTFEKNILGEQFVHVYDDDSKQETINSIKFFKSKANLLKFKLERETNKLFLVNLAPYFFSKSESQYLLYLRISTSFHEALRFCIKGPKHNHNCATEDKNNSLFWKKPNIELNSAINGWKALMHPSFEPYWTFYSDLNSSESYFSIVGQYEIHVYDSIANLEYSSFITVTE